MKITKEEVAHVAHLAHLALDEAAMERFAKQIGEVLAYVELLDQVDTRDVQPMSHTISRSNAFRADQVVESLERERCLTNAPQKEADHFQVPRVIG